jgi:hypothetical protein
MTGLGIGGADDLLIFMISSTTARTITDAKDFDVWSYGSEDKIFHIGTKVSIGDEPDNIAIIMDGLMYGGALGWRIQDYADYEVSSAQGGTSSHWDSPWMAPSWGAKDTLWIPGAGGSGSGSGFTVDYPTSYSQGREQDSAGWGWCVGAERELKASSEDPSVFITNKSVDYVAGMVAVQGGSARGGGFGELGL